MCLLNTHEFLNKSRICVVAFKILFVTRKVRACTIIHIHTYIDCCCSDNQVRNLFELAYRFIPILIAVAVIINSGTYLNLCIDFVNLQSQEGNHSR